MAQNLILASLSRPLTQVGASNSFFTGQTVTDLGDIAALTDADTISTLYNSFDAQWAGTISPAAIPTGTGQYVVVQGVTVPTDLAASYDCRRSSSIVGKGTLQQAISTNNSGAPIGGGNDSRWCLYVPSEDKNQAVYAFEYSSTDAADVNAGNNIQVLLDNITGRMPNYSGNLGPVCDGTAANDLLNDTLSIFAKGCILTWETPITSGDAILVGPGV